MVGFNITFLKLSLFRTFNPGRIFSISKQTEHILLMHICIYFKGVCYLMQCQENKKQTPLALCCTLSPSMAAHTSNSWTFLWRNSQETCTHYLPPNGTGECVPQLFISPSLFLINTAIGVVCTMWSCSHVITHTQTSILHQQVQQFITILSS